MCIRFYTNICENEFFVIPRSYTNFGLHSWEGLKKCGGLTERDLNLGGDTLLQNAYFDDLHNKQNQYQKLK